MPADVLQAIAARYGVTGARVFPMSGGTSFANWLACAAVLEDPTRAALQLVLAKILAVQLFDPLDSFHC